MTPYAEPACSGVTLSLHTSASTSCGTRSSGSPQTAGTRQLVPQLVATRHFERPLGWQQTFVRTWIEDVARATAGSAVAQAICGKAAAVRPNLKGAGLLQ